MPGGFPIMSQLYADLRGEQPERRLIKNNILRLLLACSLATRTTVNPSKLDEVNESNEGRCNLRREKERRRNVFEPSCKPRLIKRKR